jgi:hypothetical protein
MADAKVDNITIRAGGMLTILASGGVTANGTTRFYIDTDGTFVQEMIVDEEWIEQERYSKP